MEEKINEAEESVTVILNTNRIKINKRNLIDKSQYFAALLSKSYTDHRLTEHNINYEIPLTSFEDLVNWINCDQRDVIINEIESNLGRLLTLLELSVLFVVNELTETITDILRNCYLTPEDVLNVWLMAQDLGLNVLRDLSFSICLDRFTELPSNLIHKLSRKNFLQLVGNINLRVAETKDAESYLSNIAQEWMKVNEDTIPLDILKKTGRPRVYKSIVSYNIHNCDANNEYYLHCWDGDKFFELATFRCPEELLNNKNSIMGMQITARGHNLYLIGGEFGIGSGKFNTKVWRYSLITKDWHFETTMPCARRHMIAAFVHNKLLLAGGAGLYRRKLNSLDIYDVHKGTWTKGMDIPFEFVTPPDFNVVDKHLIVCFCYNKLRSLPLIYVYNFEYNDWCKVAKNSELQLRLNDLHMTVPIIKQFKNASCYIDTSKPDRINLRHILYRCDNLEYKHKIYEKYAEYFQVKEENKEENNFDMYLYLIPALNDEICDNYDYFVLMCSKNKHVEYTLIYLKRERLPWHSMPIENLNKFQSLSLDSRTMFFNLMDPSNLYVNSVVNLGCEI